MCSRPVLLLGKYNSRFRPLWHRLRPVLLLEPDIRDISVIICCFCINQPVYGSQNIFMIKAPAEGISHPPHIHQLHVWAKAIAGLLWIQREYPWEVGKYLVVLARSQHNWHSICWHTEKYNCKFSAKHCPEGSWRSTDLAWSLVDECTITPSLIAIHASLRCHAKEQPGC